ECRLRLAGAVAAGHIVEAVMGSIYDFPDVYDVVMHRAHGVLEAEVRSVQALLARRGVTQGRILELACGACVHGIPLAQAGCAVAGLDRSAAMIEAAARRAAAAGVSIELFQGDVIDFSLSTDPFDAAIFMFETFPVITEYADLTSHFRAVRRHLKPGGLYIVDLDARTHGVGTESGEWGRKTIPLPNGSVELWHEDFPGDWVRGTSHLVFHSRITLDGFVHETIDDWHLRVYSPWDLAVLVRTLEGWNLCGFYTWRDLSEDIANEAHYFMVLEASG
ncbi:MAG TPA: methyltransferase domain-containing protein, partial [Roseiflexaceae bacterium]